MEKKRNARRKKMVEEAIRALGEEFSIVDLNRALGEYVTYPGFVYPSLSRMREGGLLELIEGERPFRFKKTAALLERENEVSQKVAVGIPEEKIVEDEYIMSVVRKAIVDYPRETFSRRDILNFLRSTKEGVAINCLTVYDYVGKAFLLNKIVEKVGRKGKNMFFKRGPAIVTVEGFDPPRHSGEIIPPVPVLVSSTTIEDLELTEEETGQVVFAFMKRRENELDEAGKQIDILLKGLKEFKEMVETMTTENSRLRSALEEKDRAFSKLKDREKSLEKNVANLISALKEKDEELLLYKAKEAKRRGERIVLKGSFRELSKVRGMFPSRK